MIKKPLFAETITKEEAFLFLSQGNLVAIPTETVYGLAASITNEEALKKIFQVKKRPFFDPLIVHVSNLDQAKSCASQWPLVCDLLTKEFWPGPLTLVLPKSSIISSLITSGLSTVGLRMPRHPLAQELISRTGPLAAPSANLFGKTSPTQAIHVQYEFQNQIPVLDGGNCHIGIESTIIEIISDSELCLLRPGKIQIEEITQNLFKKNHPIKWVNKEKALSPGSMKHHYMPQTPLIIDFEHLNQEDLIILLKSKLPLLPSEIEEVQIIKPKNISTLHSILLDSSPEIAARTFYSQLRLIPTSSDIAVIKWDLLKTKGPWEGLWDRMKKAATYIHFPKNPSS